MFIALAVRKTSVEQMLSTTCKRDIQIHKRIPYLIICNERSVIVVSSSLQRFISCCASRFEKLNKIVPQQEHSWIVSFHTDA